MVGQENSSVETIIVLAPPFLRLPVPGYGGTERIVWSEAGALARKSQKDPSAPKLELWATADCERISNGVLINLVPTAETAHGFQKLFLSFNQGIADMNRLRKRLETDPTAVAHLHSEDIGFLAFGGASQEVQSRTVTTIHNLPKDWSVEYHKEMPIIAISEAQAKKVHGFDFMRVVHNGIDAEMFKPNYNVTADAPFSYLGRFSDKKNPMDAIRIAVACDAPLKIAGVPDQDDPFFGDKMDTLIAMYSGKITKVGEVSDLVDIQTGMSSKNALLANSRALLFPIKWEEPFGLVIAEANACGTPVIAYNYPGSSVDELIVNGVNGYKVDTLDEAVEAAKKVGDISRRGVRERFERNFTSNVMADNYVKVITEELPAYRRSLGLSVPAR